MEDFELVDLDDSFYGDEGKDSRGQDDVSLIVEPFDGAVSGRGKPKWGIIKKKRKHRPLTRTPSGVFSAAASVDWDVDFDYFDSYSHHAVHELMLKDRVRTLTYKYAIEMNEHLFKGKTVLDVGCGTGILSMFAARAGAARVIGIDFSNMAFVAHRIVKDNGLDSIVTIIHGKVEDLEELPHGIQKVDIIISEWMGYCLFMESMLETVLFARKKWLKINGTLMPDLCSLYITGMDDGGSKERRTQWLKQGACEFDMSHIAEMKKHSALVLPVRADQIVTDNYEILEVDLKVVYEEELIFELPFTLEMAKDEGTINALVTFFTVDFSRCHTRVGFSTAPEAPLTHWKQTVFYLSTPVHAKKGEVVKGTFTLRKYRQNQRGLQIFIEIEFEGKLMSVKECTEYILL